MAAVAHEHSPSINYPQIEIRRHSSAHTASPPLVSHNNSNVSTHPQPAWMTSLQARDRQGSAQSAPETHIGGLKALFGKRKSPPKKEEKIVIGTKHGALIKNNLKADPRGARRHPSAPIKTATVQGTQTSAHLTAEEQEMRHPHSGPPTLRGAANLPTLTRIVSGDEEDDVKIEKARADWDMQKLPLVEKVLETHGEEERATDVDILGASDRQARRKSLLDVQIKGGEAVKPKRKATVFGGWVKDTKGSWTRG